MTKITLDLLWKISTNEIYAGIHWSKRSDHKINYRAAYTSKLKALGHYDKASIVFDFTFKKNALDASNCSYMVKLLEDCIVKAGVLKDDSPKYVESITISSKKGDSDSVTITVV